MSENKGYVDTHCHILPGIDDGASGIEESRQLLEASVAQGVRRFCFTPHFYPDKMDFHTFYRNRREAAAKIDPITKELGVEYILGAEVAYTPAIMKLPVERLTYGKTNYMLLELSFRFEPLDVEGGIRRLRAAGIIPVLAHVERYPYVTEDPELLKRWVAAGALAQVNAPGVLGDGRTKKQIQKYIHGGLAHVMGSDTHSIRRRPPRLGDGLAALSGHDRQYLHENAVHIFRGEDMTIGKPGKPAGLLKGWREMLWRTTRR